MAAIRLTAETAPAAFVDMLAKLLGKGLQRGDVPMVLKIHKHL
jgi:hypothetical protein